jgi:hypothetical protein
MGCVAIRTAVHRRFRIADRLRSGDAALRCGVAAGLPSGGAAWRSRIARLRRGGRERGAESDEG